MSARVARTFLVLTLLALPTGLWAQTGREATIQGTVTTASDGLSLPGAEVSIPALQLLTTTDQAGAYVLRVPIAGERGRTVELRVNFPGLVSQSTRVSVSPGSEHRHDFAMVVGFQEEITVGSRAPGVAAQQAVPVDIITAAQIRASGFSETAQIIQAIAPSFNFPRPTITDGTDTVRPATLRGLGPDQVLVLINGKRRHTSSLVHVNGSIGRGSTGVDLNAIPPSAIERVEVLRDGAAAQYGSDAIAGVINIVLKSGRAPSGLGYKFGATTEGDGELHEVSGHYGVDLFGGGLMVAADYRDRNRTNRAGPDPRAQGTDPGVAPPPQPNHRWGDGDTNDLLVFANGEFPLGPAQTSFLYAFGGVSRRLANSAGFFRLASDARNWKSIYPQGFLPQIEPDVVDASALGGVRGAARGWVYDASLGYGRNSFDFHVVNSLNASLGPGIPPNQTEFYAGTLLYDQIVGTLDISRGVQLGVLENVNVAFGAEWRREAYGILAGEPNSYLDGGVPNQLGGRAAPGAQVFPGFRPSNEADVSRNSVSGYLDLEVDRTGWLRLGVAGRAERYSDFGGTANGKLTVRVQPAKPVVFRAAVSTGFRAPSLQQSWFSAVSTNFLNVDGTLVPFEVGTFPVENPVAQVLGARPLEPETSLNLSGGVVVQATDELQVSVDGYRIDIDDRIVFSGNFTGGRISELLAPFGANGARFFTNAIDTETTGMDVQAAYRVRLAGGDNVRLSAGYNRSETRIVRLLPTPPQLAGFENVLFDRIERRRIECGQPRGNVILSGRWDRHPLAASARTQRYGEFCSFTATETVDQTYGAKWLTDFDVTYRFRQASLQVGIQNAFDVYPDENIAPNSFNGIQVYPSHSPFGMNGRFVYARVGYSF
jgi:iron complex outermembrane recepter protein